MLELEQYLVIYFLAIFLLNDRDVKIICTFLCFDFLIDSALYSNLRFTPDEYLISITMLEATCLIFILQFISCFKLRNLFILCYIPTLLNPLFLLSIDHWISRSDIVSTILFIFCSNVARYSNELFLTYVIYTTRVKNLRTNFWHMFVGINYITILFR